jgi:RNA polymerase sigma-70 factor (ECF subfamily)
VGASRKASSAASETEQLFGQSRDSLVRYIRYHLDDPSEAEDIAQEAFVRFYQVRSRDEKITQPRAWLFRVAHNLLVDYGRKRKPDLLDEQGWMAMEGYLVVEPNGLNAAAEVSKLPWDRLSRMELECLRLRTEGLKFREIGEVLDLSISTVVSYVSRGLTKLRPSNGKEKKKIATPDHSRTAPAL